MRSRKYRVPEVSRWLPAVLLGAMVLALAGCSEHFPQTTLAPRGEAARISDDVFMTTVKWAAIVFVLVVAQGQIGYLGHEFPLAGALHGLNALALFGAALYTGRRMRTATRSGDTAAEERVAAPVS